MTFRKQDYTTFAEVMNLAEALVSWGKLPIDNDAILADKSLFAISADYSANFSHSNYAYADVNATAFDFGPLRLSRWPISDDTRMLWPSYSLLPWATGKYYRDVEAYYVGECFKHHCLLAIAVNTGCPDDTIIMVMLDGFEHEPDVAGCLGKYYRQSCDTESGLQVYKLKDSYSISEARLDYARAISKCW